MTSLLVSPRRGHRTTIAGLRCHLPTVNGMSNLEYEVYKKFPLSQEAVLETPLPGRRATREEREVALRRLVSMVTDKQRVLVDEVPLRCSFGSFSKSLVPRDLIAPIALLVEGNGLCHVCASADEVQDYFNRRHPWETYDYYCLEINGGRCVCVTHDDEVQVYGS